MWHLEEWILSVQSHGCGYIGRVHMVYTLCIHDMHPVYTRYVPGAESVCTRTLSRFRDDRGLTSGNSSSSSKQIATRKCHDFAQNTVTLYHIPGVGLGLANKSGSNGSSGADFEGRGRGVRVAGTTVSRCFRFFSASDLATREG